MYICIACKKEMLCFKNGVGIDYGNGHVYPSDIFECPYCQVRIAATNRNSIHDPEHKTQDAYINMEEK